MPMPYTSENASGYPINDIQAQKMFSFLPEKDYVLNDKYALGGADEAIRLAQAAYNSRSDKIPDFMTQNSPSNVLSTGGATDDLRIIQENKLDRI